MGDKAGVRWKTAWKWIVIRKSENIISMRCWCIINNSQVVYNKFIGFYGRSFDFHNGL